MKTCPVCKSQVFDDMPVCFGCMHRFDEGGEQATSAAHVPDVAYKGAEPASSTPGNRTAGPVPTGAGAEGGPSAPLATPVSAAAGDTFVSPAPSAPAEGGQSVAHENAAGGGAVPAAAYVPLSFDAGVARFQLVVRLEPLPLGAEG
jgi:hypothetical protein